MPNNWQYNALGTMFWNIHLLEIFFLENSSRSAVWRIILIITSAGRPLTMERNVDFSGKWYCQNCTRFPGIFRELPENSGKRFGAKAWISGSFHAFQDFPGLPGFSGISEISRDSRDFPEFPGFSGVPDVFRDCRDFPEFPGFPGFCDFMTRASSYQRFSALFFTGELALSP